VQGFRRKVIFLPYIGKNLHMAAGNHGSHPPPPETTPTVYDQPSGLRFFWAFDSQLFGRLIPHGRGNGLLALLAFFFYRSMWTETNRSFPPLCFVVVWPGKGGFRFWAVPRKAKPSKKMARAACLYSPVVFFVGVLSVFVLMVVTLFFVGLPFGSKNYHGVPAPPLGSSVLTEDLLGVAPGKGFWVFSPPPIFFSPPPPLGAPPKIGAGKLPRRGRVFFVLGGPRQLVNPRVKRVAM